MDGPEIEKERRPTVDWLNLGIAQGICSRAEGTNQPINQTTNQTNNNKKPQNPLGGSIS